MWPRLAPVGVALVGALCVIGLAVYAVQPSTSTVTVKDSTLVSVEEQPARGGADWALLLAAIASTTTDVSPSEFRAPKELSTTEAIVQELAATQLLLSDGSMSSSDAERIIAELAKRNIKPVAPNDTYTAASLTVVSTVTLEDYAEHLRTAMESSAYVDEYELTVFARTLKLEDHDGTPALNRAAGLYRTVEHALVAMPVPPALTTAHLELVKSVAFLARSVELMAGWTGDHFDALVYIDAFVRAEVGVERALNSLGSAMLKFGKSS